MKKSAYILQAITVMSGILLFAACTKEAAQPVNNSNAVRTQISSEQTLQTIRVTRGYPGQTNTGDSTKATK